MPEDIVVFKGSQINELRRMLLPWVQLQHQTGRDGSVGERAVLKALGL